MNEVINKHWLAGDNFMSEMYLTQIGLLDLHIVLVDHLLKTRNWFNGI